MARTAKKANLTEEQSQQIYKWYQKDQELKAAKEAEFELRQEIVRTCGFDPAKLDGSQTLDLGSGWKLKAVKTTNYKVINDNGEAVRFLQLIADANGANRPDLAASLMKWVADLSTKVLKQVLPIVEQNESLKAAMSACITSKPGAPQLAMIPPGEEEKTESEVA